MEYSDTYVKYASYLAEDFVNDKQFLQWVAEPHNVELSIFWNKFLLNHPRKTLEIEYAVFLAKNKPENMSSSDVSSLWDSITNSLSKKPIL